MNLDIISFEMCWYAYSNYGILYRGCMELFVLLASVFSTICGVAAGWLLHRTLSKQKNPRAAQGKKNQKESD